MIRFEFIKLHRKLIIPLIIVLALLLSYFTYKSDFNAMNTFIENYGSESYRTSILSLFTENIFPDSKHLAKQLDDEERERLNKESDALFRGFVSDQYSILKGEDIEKEATKLRDRVSKYVEDEYKILKKYKLQLPDKYASDIEFVNFELEKMLENNTTLTDLAYGRYSSNPMRVLLSLSNKLLGIFPMLILILAFIPIISSEKSNGTILLLETQPIDRFRMVISKQIVIVISSIIYFLSIVFFTIIIGFAFGQKWHNSHLEIYRIFSNIDNLKYLYAYQLLIKIFFRYLIMTLFFSSIIIFISERSKDYMGGIIILLSGIIILSLFTKTFSGLKNSLNPIYALNYYENILGRIESGTINNVSIATNVEGRSIFIYLPYLCLAILFSILTVIMPKEYKYSKKTKTNKLYTILGFELEKIRLKSSFTKSIISTLAIFFVVFLSLYLKDIWVKRYYDTYITSVSESKLSTVKSNSRYRLSDYKETYGIDSDEYKKSKKELEAKIKEVEKFYEDSLKAYNFYKDKNGREFYDFKYKEIVYNDMVFSLRIKGNFFTSPSYQESKALYKEMSKENILPLMISTHPFMSSLEDVDPWKLEQNEDNVLSHSSFYLARRIERTYPIDFLILSLISIISFGHYSYDKENGNQIELMYTEPIKRSKYHIRKILASFLVGILTLGLIFLLLFILGLLTEGLGDPRFPVVEYIRSVSLKQILIESDPYFKLIPLWKYDLKLIVSYIFQIGFLASFGAFISIFVKEKIKVLAISLGITGAFIYLVSLIKSPLKVIIPFTHIKASELANGSFILNSFLKTNNICISLGVLLAWSIFFGVVGSLIVGKKEVR